MTYGPTAGYLCPVCAYDQLPGPPCDHRICPQCGTHFDYEDAAPTHRETLERWHALRVAWINNGRPFWRIWAEEAKVRVKLV